jgi:exosortase D (VPLPA-CTERM-specific)
MAQSSTSPKYSDRTGPSGFSSAPLRKPGLRFASYILLAALILVIFQGFIANIFTIWLNYPEYNYGPIVPILSVLMIWESLQKTPNAVLGRGWTGVVCAVIGLFLGTLAYHTEFDFIGRFGLFLTIAGSITAAIGESRALQAWAGIFFLLFSLPLASMVQSDLTLTLQLVATKGGVAIIRAFGIPVFSEGNIIDLGRFQLQVAEACSGLRYLFPLTTFTYLCAYLFRAGGLLRTVVFLSSIPITVIMNIVRIAVTGILVSAFGISAAEGFFHYFEGWAIFCVCIALLFLEMKLICLADGRGASLLQRLDLRLPRMVGNRPASNNGSVQPTPAVLALIVLCIISLGTEKLIGSNGEIALQRSTFAGFPDALDGMSSRDIPLDQETVDKLDATDHINRDYSALGDVAPNTINLFISYYASQHSGSAVHSPQFCIPGGGWDIEQIQEVPNPAAGFNKLAPAKLMRLIIRRAQQRQLVYYWFEQGGEPMTNGYFGKFKLISNSIFAGRTDGALVRFVSPIGDNSQLERTEKNLQSFVRAATRVLPQYLPK